VQQDLKTTKARLPASLLFTAYLLVDCARCHGHHIIGVPTYIVPRGG
jgi:hypothetical protein